MTSERLTEIRKWVTAAHFNLPIDLPATGSTVSNWELLVHIDAQQAEIEAGNNAIGRALDEAGKAWSQVAALREALDSFRDSTSCPSGKFCSLPEHPCLFHQVQHVLADTEAAAREHDQRLRLEGAREYVRRWDTRIGRVTHADLLDDMEAENGE